MIHNYDHNFVDKVLIMNDNEGFLFVVLLDLYIPVFRALSEKWERFCEENLEKENIKIDYSKDSENLTFLSLFIYNLSPSTFI